MFLVFIFVFQVVDWPWVQYFSRKRGHLWKIDDVRFTVLEKDVVKTLAPPNIQMCGRCFCYKFNGKLILIFIFYFEAVSSNHCKIKGNQYKNDTNE